MKNSLEDLLAQQHDQLVQLLALLEQEREVLENHSPEDLINIAQEKNTLLLAVQEADNLISQQPTFASEKAEGLHQESLKEIADLLTQCKKLNTVNGMVIQQSQIAVEKMKTSLLESNNRSSMTYDNKGKASGTLKSVGLKA